MQGKDKKSINVTDLLDELQTRVLESEDFMNKVTELAMKQA